MLTRYKDRCWRCDQTVDFESNCFSGPDPLPHNRSDGIECRPEPVEFRIDRFEPPRVKTPILPLTAAELCSVQPMTADTGIVFEVTFEPKTGEGT